MKRSEPSTVEDFEMMRLRVLAAVLPRLLA
jgi:hypothetical protein